MPASAARGARAGIIITAKFSDAGAEGAQLEREIVAIARAGGMRLIGPNCLGVISPANRVILCLPLRSMSLPCRSAASASSARAAP